MPDEGSSPPRSFPQERVSTPPGACDLLLVRHGQSQALVEGAHVDTLDRHANPPLSEEGTRQAKLLGDRLATESIDAIYVTSLRRTAETAAPLAAKLGIEPLIEPDLRELYLGEWEGWILRQKLADREPDAVRVIREQRWDLVPGSEPLEAFHARLFPAVERIARSHPDERVVVVSHGAAIAEILGHATDSRPWAFLGADNASISHLIVTEERWILRRYNDTTHLDSHFSLRAAPPI
jgi:2,3-bisphosphoglycerate-dependent phosphoglycerate mutase